MRRIAEIDAARIAPVGIEIARQLDARMRLRFERLEARHRIGDQRLDRRALIDQAIDERGVGAVLQEPPHEIGEQILMPADRRIDAARELRRAEADDLVVERLAHAVQALELEIAFCPDEIEDSSNRMRVMRRELRKERIARRPDALGASEIGHIGRELAGVDREFVEAALLRALDLAVPIGAFDETQHQAAMMSTGQRGEPIDQRQGAFLIGLQRETEPVPTGELRRRRQALDEIEREIEAIGFLGIDGEADAGALRLLRQFEQDWRQLAQHAIALCFLIARMQRRELYRDAGRAVEIAAVDARADRGNRRAIALGIARGIIGGARRLAQHVEGIAIAARFLGRGAVERFRRWCGP